MTIAKKFSLTGCLLMALTVVLGGVSLVGLAKLQRIVGLLGSDAFTGLSESARVEQTVTETHAAMLAYVSSSDAGREARAGQVRELRERLKQTLEKYAKTMIAAEDRELFGKLQSALERYTAACDAVLASRRSGAQKKYQKEALESGVFTEAKAASDALTAFNRNGGAAYMKDAATAEASARWTISLLSVLSIGAGSGLLFFIVRGIKRALYSAIQELTQGSEHVASAAAQISGSSQSLAQGSTEQAAALQETSASAEEISSMVRRNNENASASAALVGQSLEKYQAANGWLGEMQAAMNEINESSGKIARIIRVIDEIAFQTNILALNAAVEAARAGEAGMGFAVVADEVRNLAQRCAQAARDTAGLIEESIGKSGNGKQKVDRLAEAIRAITEESSRIGALVNEVSQGSQEQSRGIDQVGKALAQMEQVTHKTAANAEENASASEELTAQSEALRHVVVRLSALV